MKGHGTTSLRRLLAGMPRGAKGCVEICGMHLEEAALTFSSVEIEWSTENRWLVGFSRNLLKNLGMWSAWKWIRFIFFFNFQGYCTFSNVVQKHNCPKFRAPEMEHRSVLAPRTVPSDTRLASFNKMFRLAISLFLSRKEPVTSASGPLGCSQNATTSH